MRERNQGFDSPARRAFRQYLRTGRRAPDCASIEFKFNPYHDPRNGQFTFAPGGPRSLKEVIVSPAGYVPGGPTGRTGRGSNIRAFHDPMTLHQVFPSLRTAPGGVFVAATDGLFNLSGPANELSAELTRLRANALIAQIRKVDPNYRFESLGFPQTAQGRANYLGGLRMDRAVAFYRLRKDPRPLQVETLRFLQKATDRAYAEAMELVNSGKLNIRLSSQEAIGNFVDRRVRRELKSLYEVHRLPTDRDSNIRIIGREYATSGSDRTYRIPDSRVDRVAFDVSLTAKSIHTPQIKGFFAGDFAPSLVIVVRPSQLGRGSTYAIKRPR
jgi:hypothetical protein